MPDLIVATENSGKVREFAQFFATAPQWRLLPKPTSIQLRETGTTFRDNAVEKALTVAIASRCWALADDSGLAVAALDGRPGVYSARYAPTDPERIARLLQELEGIDDRRAEFVCAIAIVDPQGTVRASVAGRCKGEILTEARGSGGFGYDPVFYVPAIGCTFAEMSPSQKQQYSHRGLALQQLLPYLEEIR